MSITEFYYCLLVSITNFIINYVLCPIFSPHRLYNINTRIVISSAFQGLIYSSLVRPTKYGTKVLLFLVRSNVSSKILLLTLTFDFLMALKRTFPPIATSW